jgi:hypothetical protein
MRFAPAAPSATPHDAAREVFRAPLDFPGSPRAADRAA